MNRTLFALTLAAVLVCCGVGGSVAGSGNDPPCCKPMPGPDEIDQGLVLYGSTAIAESRYVLIHDSSELQAFWSEHNSGVSPMPPLPPIDFTTTMLVGVVVAQANDCYFVLPRGMLLVPSVGTADHIVVSYAVQLPHDGCTVHHSSVSRILLEAMKRSDLPVVFVHVSR